jgi:hypothetical protein
LLLEGRDLLQDSVGGFCTDKRTYLGPLNCRRAWSCCEHAGRDKSGPIRINLRKTQPVKRANVAGKDGHFNRAEQAGEDFGRAEAGPYIFSAINGFTVMMIEHMPNAYLTIFYV